MRRAMCVRGVSGDGSKTGDLREASAIIIIYTTLAVNCHLSRLQSH